MSLNPLLSLNKVDEKMSIKIYAKANGQQPKMALIGGARGEPSINELIRRVQAPSLDWLEVFVGLDNPIFQIRTKSGLQRLTLILLSGIALRPFPVGLLYRPWGVNKPGQQDCVSLRAKDLLDALMASEDVNRSLDEENRSLWLPEFAVYMMEGTPGSPYGGLMSCFNIVEYNMRLRSEDVSALLRPNESLLSISFPALGVPDFTDPSAVPRSTHPDSVGRLVFYSDEDIYSGHPRFRNLVRNIQGRRGEKVAINVEASRAALPDHIYMDHMGFGMGLCCLQMTFQGVTVMEARWLYDQLTPITIVDYRTPFERRLVSSACDGYSKFHAIPKTRYDSTDCYIYPCSAQYNDIQLQHDEQLYQIAGNVDEHLARYIAHMSIRDPLQVFEDRIVQDDQKFTEHFETILSSNWMNMRFKLPPPDDSNIGWRFEFRPTEVQLTHFENAAYCCSLVLLTRVIVSYRLVLLFCRWVKQCSGAEAPPMRVMTDGAVCWYYNKFGANVIVECPHSTTTTNTMTTTTTTTTTPSPPTKETTSLDVAFVVVGCLVAIAIIAIAADNLRRFLKKNNKKRPIRGTHPKSAPTIAEASPAVPMDPPGVQPVRIC